ncbi:hypothetical protein [Muricoccus radiodurans]|uniref:hypothetical protein n=1 Tax=Muricoccus radiodurans TaxID=2231721 RepID=UPI003CF21994
MRRPLLAAFLLLAACTAEEQAASEAAAPVQVLAARLPDRVADQSRGPIGEPAPNLIARYRAEDGSYTSVFLTSDPGGEREPDGIAGRGIREEFLRSIQAMALTVQSRGGLADRPAETTIRHPGGAELLCGAMAVAPLALAEVVCLSRIEGSVAKIRMTAIASPHGAEATLVNAYAVAVEIADSLRRNGNLPPGVGPIFRT